MHESKKVYLIIFLIIICLFSRRASAQVEGLCSNCHTMHYSQQGEVPTECAGSGPYNALLINDCIGCHTGTNDGTNNTPYIFSSTAPAYGDTGTEGDCLAGGNFYWSTQAGGDVVSHNVEGIAGADVTLSVPPGFDATYTDYEGNVAGGGSWTAGQQVTCAGTYGCHGHHDTENSVSAIQGGHHASGSTIDGSSVGKSYRFLIGILGLEDPDWEYQPNSTAHNQYYGVDRGAVPDNQTISYLCAQCHGVFHSISGAGGSSPWLRHPTDFDMGNTGGSTEYRDYPGDASHTYSVIAPVASTDVSSVVSSVTFADDTIVTCISCHRAHGTLYFKLMRWDYKNWPGGTNGCNVCHTEKD
jgi:hypothetical protein